MSTWCYSTPDALCTKPFRLRGLRYPLSWVPGCQLSIYFSSSIRRGGVFCCWFAKRAPRSRSYSLCTVLRTPNARRPHSNNISGSFPAATVVVGVRTSDLLVEILSWAASEPGASIAKPLLLLRKPDLHWKTALRGAPAAPRRVEGFRQTVAAPEELSLSFPSRRLTSHPPTATSSEAESIFASTTLFSPQPQSSGVYEDALDRLLRKYTRAQAERFHSARTRL